MFADVLIFRRLAGWGGEGGRESIFFLQLLISVSEVNEKMKSSLTPPSSCEDVFPTS